MSKDTHDGKGHTGKVTVRIPDKDFGRVPIVIQQSNCDTNEADYDHDTKYMMIHGWQVLLMIHFHRPICNVIILLLLLLLQN